MFLIDFLDEPLEYPFDDTSIPAASGRMILGKTMEDFLSNLALWSKEDYKSHWKRELKALFEGAPKVALIVSFNDPEAAWNMEIWPVYRDGEYAHFQNHFPLYSDLPRDFKIMELSSYIKDRATFTEDGDQISEWRVSMRDIEIFLQRVSAF